MRGPKVATVDRVLNARAPVNPGTAEQVFQAAEAVGYFAARLINSAFANRRPTYRFGVLLRWGPPKPSMRSWLHAISARQRSITPPLT